MAWHLAPQLLHCEGFHSIVRHVLTCDYFCARCDAVFRVPSQLLDALTPIFSFLRCSQHNYEVRGLTGLVDLYVMTGNQTYLDAALGGWAMLRESWQHVGGSLAINEEVYFPPKSYCERSKATQIACLRML